MAPCVAQRAHECVGSPHALSAMPSGAECFCAAAATAQGQAPPLLAYRYPGSEAALSWSGWGRLKRRTWVGSPGAGPGSSARGGGWAAWLAGRRWGARGRGFERIFARVFFR